MNRRKLPAGIQNFREIREEGYYYVDKTAYLQRLATTGKHYFLSRPRRFGKSLFVDTVKELFEGSETLFRGLDIHDGWNWNVRHPVICFSFAAGRFGQRGLLAANFADKLASLEETNGVASKRATPEGRLAYLLETCTSGRASGW